MTYRVGSPRSKRYFLKIDKAREYALLHATGERGVPIYSDTGIEVGQVVIWNLKERTGIYKDFKTGKHYKLRSTGATGKRIR